MNMYDINVKNTMFLKYTKPYDKYIFLILNIYYQKHRILFLILKSRL